MKVYSEEPAININSVLQNLKEKEADKNVLQNKTTGADEVHLSPRAKEFQRIKDVLETVPDTREQKVAAIKDSIEKGTYKPDSKKTAENLINESLLDLFI